MGHEQASTTLNRYTHYQEDSARRILAAFEDPGAFWVPPTGKPDSEEPEEDGQLSA